jgi:1-deoxy-D-xylulose-5-phosphate synthase
VEVINARFAKPLDEQLIISVFERHLPVLILEDNTMVGGFASAILELASDRGYALDTLERIGIPDRFIEHDSLDSLRKSIGLTPPEIAASVKTLLLKSHALPKQILASYRLQES